jgi:hypothetical protein
MAIRAGAKRRIEGEVFLAVKERSSVDDDMSIDFLSRSDGS